MAEPSGVESAAPEPGIRSDARIYVDASALAKLYVPEPESDELDAFLRGRRGLMIAELAITEVISAVARRTREGELGVKQASSIHRAVLQDADSGAFARVDLSPEVHRHAERLLFASGSLPLRTLDALHLALAYSGTAEYVLTFDRRMQQAAEQVGLTTIQL